jgi:hypothetical protein
MFAKKNSKRLIRKNAARYFTPPVYDFILYILFYTLSGSSIFCGSQRRAELIAALPQEVQR